MENYQKLRKRPVESNRYQITNQKEITSPICRKMFKFSTLAAAAESGKAIGFGDFNTLFYYLFYDT